MTGSTRSIAASLSPLTAHQTGLGGRANGVFARYIVYGSQQLQWINGALGGATMLADTALEVRDPDMELALLRLTGPRLQATMSGATLLAALLATPPHPGWRPLGPDDEFLRTLLPDEEA